MDFLSTLNASISPTRRASKIPDEKGRLTLCSSVLKSFRIAKLFEDNTEPINHIDYDSTGELVVTSGDDDRIVIYECSTGTKKESIFSKKYGCGLIRFANPKDTVLHSSTKVDDTIRYLNLLDNKFIRYFTGHTKRVMSLVASPTEDKFMFISASEDGDLRLWDLRASNSIGIMHLQHNRAPVAAFDPEGLVFAVGPKNSDGNIKLYDVRNYKRGPYLSFMINSFTKEHEWTSLKFSPNGKTIMTCNPSEIMLIDSFDGHMMHRFIDQSEESKHNRNMEASFSPDSKYVLRGGVNGIVHVWDLKRNEKLCTFSSGHPGHIDFVRFNPKYMMLTTAAGTELGFWIPV